MKNKTRLLITLLFSALLSGCTYYPVKYTAENPLEHIVVKNYTLSTVENLNVGETLVSKKTITNNGNTALINTYTPTKSFDINFHNGIINFLKGTEYYSVYELNYNNLIQVEVATKNPEQQLVVYVPVNNDGLIVGNDLLYSKESTGIKFVNHLVEVRDHRNNTFENNSYLPKFNFLGKTLKPLGAEEVNSFQEDIVYIGKSKNTIKLLYREYQTGIIKSSFTHELLYDMDEGNIIRYRDFRIKVIDSTSENIVYEVLSDS